MNTLPVYPMQCESFAWTLLAIAGIFALTAILSPRLFSTLNAWSSTRIDIDRFAKKLDKRIDPGIPVWAFVNVHFSKHNNVAVREDRLGGTSTTASDGVN